MVPGRESGLTRSGEPVKRKKSVIPEPEDKLDATTTVVGVVSGPEDAALDWRQIDWRQAERNVRRLRQRIFTASRAGDLSRVRRLQALMLRSRSNALVSVRRVTERNAGRLTAGVDGEVVLTPKAKEQLVARVKDSREPFKALAVRRVFIPKPGGKQRPLGIPVITDRVHQARVLNALEPEWEARFEPKSYGFRPGRGCHDAIEAIFQAAKGKNPRRPWVLDADLAGAFDRIGHDHLLATIGSFPARGMVRAWLKAGVVENGRLSRTEEGTPQGGVISPLLLNIALHGMETAAGARYGADAHANRRSPILIRYADDFVRHEAPYDRAEMKGLRRGSVAAGSRRRGQPDLGDAREGGSSPDNDGTGWHCQTAWVRQSRREGVTRVNQWQSSVSGVPAPNLADGSVSSVRLPMSWWATPKTGGKSPVRRPW
jgi:RNA-directed DNA polymerase